MAAAYQQAAYVAPGAVHVDVELTGRSRGKMLRLKQVTTAYTGAAFTLNVVPIAVVGGGQTKARLPIADGDYVYDNEPEFDISSSAYTDHFRVYVQWLDAATNTEVTPPGNLGVVFWFDVFE